MFRFIKEHSYEIIKLFLTQIALSIMGLILSFSTNSNPLLYLLSSLFTSVFFWCLLYTEGWELGAKDRSRILNGRMKYNPYKGTIYSLFANIPNFLLIVIMLVSLALGSFVEFFGSAYAISYFIERLICAAYMGINNYLAPSTVINEVRYIISDSVFQPLFYLVFVIPSVISVTLGYILGAKDKKLLTVNKPNNN